MSSSEFQKQQGQDEIQQQMEALISRSECRKTAKNSSPFG